MDNNHITDIFDRYLEGKATPTEIIQIEAWLDNQATVPNDWTRMEREEKAASLRLLFADIQQTIQQETPVVSMKRRRSWVSMAAAAVLLLVVGTGAYLYTRYERNQATLQQAGQSVQDLPPGSDKAILTLADGKQIILDSASGNLAREGGVTVINLAGQLNYEAAGGGSGDVPVTYHTVSTPRGGQYQLVLSDGSKVWLNAASSLRFPTAFTGNRREVELTGEGYFEVAHNKEQPFQVRAGEMNVQVLGTHFNINSYADEGAIRATLLEGSVKVSTAEASNTPAILKPGEQARLSAGAQLAVESGVDTESVVAWKNGKFSFQNADLATIMRQMARWYDVEVVFEDKINDRYTVTVGRDVPVSKLFQFIEMSGGVHFTIEDRKVIVRK